MQNLQTLCRICMKTLDLTAQHSLFTSNDEGLTLAGKLAVITQQQINEQDDLLPKLICDACKTSVDNAYALKLQYELTQDALRVILDEREQSKCNVCDTATSENNILNHMLDVHSDDHTCRICNKSYQNVKNLRLHMGTHSGNKPYCCEQCGKCFAQGRAFACHLRIHKSTSVSSDPATLEKVKRRQYQCTVCMRQFSNTSNLKAHQRLHNGEYPYECHICGKKFAQSNSHSYHMKVHLGDRPFKCEFCDKTFTTNGQLINHRRRHTGERPFKCDECGKTFAQNGTYKMHLMQHYDTKPHLCNVCGKKYAQNYQLVEHMRTHTGQLLKCTLCEKCYTTSGNLAAHMKIHRGVKEHVCNVCGKGFYTATKLVKHKRTHSDERPFTCQFCGKCFKTNDVLKVHVRTHTGECPYACDACPKTFTNRSQLVVHLKTHKLHN